MTKLSTEEQKYAENFLLAQIVPLVLNLTSTTRLMIFQLVLTKKICDNINSWQRKFIKVRLRRELLSFGLLLPGNLLIYSGKEAIQLKKERWSPASIKNYFKLSSISN